MFLNTDNGRVYICDDCRSEISEVQEDHHGTCQKCLDRCEDEHRDYVDWMFWGGR